ncbi:MAG: Molybdate-binding periplasmic protein [Alphaproteobacteria bacterium MarineAlpha11_Bin1]|nr:MAG: Molybdate-binding periplasmic protein [Alphaproteobacteria bacterium MarineAlpha11_Bin1]|tara:strand:+ start:2170 stop:2949 length:780 start_codon:yes stop_codon:yes gene_type:complete
MVNNGMRFIFVPLAFIALTQPSQPEAAPLTVYAAASTLPVIHSIEKLWILKHSRKLRVVYGSSGALARQISAGAPADVYISANPKWIDYLIEKKSAHGETRHSVLENRLALISSTHAKRIRIKDLSSAIPAILATGGRLALGDPRHVPAGQYAREALRSLGIWNSINKQTAYTHNVRFALALVQRGEASLGIVYQTDARNVPLVQIIAKFPKELHSSIKYEVVGTRSGHRSTGDFIAILKSAEARTLYRTAGFIVRDQS